MSEVSLGIWELFNSTINVLWDSIMIMVMLALVHNIIDRLPPAHGHQLLVTGQLLGHFDWRLHQG